MQDDLHDFLARFAGAVVMSLVPVAPIAFLSIPLSLGRYPGEGPSDANAPAAHMT
jgi:hypothetical protein